MYLCIHNLSRHLVKNSSRNTLGQDISPHSLALTVLQLDLAIFNTVGDEEMLDVEVTGPLRQGVALLIKSNRTGVVVQDSRRTHLVPEFNQEVTRPDNASRAVLEARQLTLT